MIKSFELGARKYIVEHPIEMEDEIGLCDPDIGVISIAQKTNGKRIPKDVREQALYHEVVHAIFDAIGRVDLYHDENLVQSIAVLLHQFEKTKRSK